MPGAHDEPRPQCPRCGYDQSGIVATWTSQCPMEGVCSECGLMIVWRDVLNRALHGNLNLFEHAHQHRIKALARTVWLALWPGRLWRVIRLHHVVGFGRLVIVGVSALALAHVLVAIISGLSVLVLEPGSPISRAPRREVEALQALMWPYGNKTFAFGLDSVRGAVREMALLLLVAAVVTPLSFFLLTSSLHHANVRWRHVGRVAAYSAAGVVVALALGTAACFALYLADHDGWVPRYWPPIRWQAGVAALVGSAWMWWWWREAVGRYLQLPHPGAVAATMVTIGLLAPLAVWLGMAYLLLPMLS